MVKHISSRRIFLYVDPREELEVCSVNYGYLKTWNLCWDRKTAGGSLLIVKDLPVVFVVCKAIYLLGIAS